MSAPRALALNGDEIGSTAWRLWQPMAELRKRGFLAHSSHTNESHKFLPLIAAGVYNCIITPRLAWPAEAGLPWQRAIRRAGLCWIYEVDDDVFSEGILGRQYRVFESERKLGWDGLEQRRQERIKVINECDAITVSSRRLATVVRNHAPASTPIYVVPNAIDAKWFKQVMRGIGRVPELEGKLTIGWAGGNRDLMDTKELAEAWGILAEKYPDVMFVVQGWIPDNLDVAVPKHRRVTLPWLPLSEYPRALINVDIGCCVVAPSNFNEAKTPIKWFEMTLAGAACVVSPTLYGQAVTDGEDALLARTTEQWVSQLSRLIESEQLRRELQDNARTTVMTNHSLDNNWWRWPQAWGDAVEQYQDKQARTLVLARA